MDDHKSRNITLTEAVSIAYNWVH